MVRVVSKRILEQLQDAIVVGNVKKAKRLTEYIVNRGTSTKHALETIMRAMNIANERYGRKEYSSADVAMSSSAMKQAYSVLEPFLEVDNETWEKVKLLLVR